MGDQNAGVECESQPCFLVTEWLWIAVPFPILPVSSDYGDSCVHYDISAQPRTQSAHVNITTVTCSSSLHTRASSNKPSGEKSQFLKALGQAKLHIIKCCQTAISTCQATGLATTALQSLGYGVRASAKTLPLGKAGVELVGQRSMRPGGRRPGFHSSSVDL